MQLYMLFILNCILPAQLDEKRAYNYRVASLALGGGAGSPDRGLHLLNQLLLTLHLDRPRHNLTHQNQDLHLL